MNEMTCRYTSSTTPRVLPRRHDEDCADHETCKGCLPCPEAHCRNCGKEHAEQTCAGCAGDAREDLRAIRDLCAKLPTEAVHRGINSEAMALMAPAADPEAWGHLTTSLKVGRLPVGYLVCDRCNAPYPCAKHADNELHPLFVLGTWEFVWRDALDHEADELVTIEGAVRYLDMQLSYMAGYEHAPFEDFARDLGKCRRHLEAVLHDGEQTETGASCMKCEVPQVKVWAGREMPWSTKEQTILASDDGWACPKCRTFSSKDRYTLSVKHLHRENADWLTDADMEIRTNVKAGTVRSWARDDAALVRKRKHSGRTVYSVSDVLRQARERGMMSAC